MRLFSEKVTPTFTSSNQNILTIKDFNEIFFDVYELEINGSKYIAEKISEYKGNPVVNIPIVIDGRELEAPFVIQRGDFEVIFNESNSTFIKVASSETEEVFIEEKNRDEEVEEIIFEKKESILEEIKQARQAASKFAESVQQKNIRRDKERTSRDKEVLAETASNFKKVLLEEFLSIAENTREELFTYNQQENEKTYEYITDTVDRLAEKLTLDLNEEIASQHKSVVEKFEKDISSLAQNILTDKLLKEIAVNNSENIKTADIRFETVSKTLAKVLSDHEVQLDIKIKKALANYETHITALEQSNVELNDSITKNTNKALSRIGNVKTQLEESIDSISLELVDKITLAESKIKDYYNDRITLIESSVTDIEAKDKAYILELIEESKQSILKEVNEIKSNVPTLVTERTLEPKGDDDIKKIKTDLEKSISNRFSQELANIRRVIELSSGGGSVAKQFAAGGTMDGNLNVTGQYLSAGVDLLSIFSSGGSTDRLVNGSYQVVLSSNGDLTLPGAIVTASNSKLDLVNFGPNTAYLTTTPDDSTALFMGASVAELRANTYASITTNTGDTPRLWEFNTDGGLVFPDGSTQTTAFINNLSEYATLNYLNSSFFKLSGGTITGATVINNNLTVNGNLTATGTTTFNNTIFSVTSALSVVHVGAGPAVWVGNNGTGDIASFYDIDQNIEVLHVGGINSTFPNVGVHTSNPNERFTVSGNISASNDIYANGSKLASENFAVAMAIALG